MKIVLLALLLHASVFSFCFSQEEEKLLQAPSDWRYERLEFPLPFAPSLPLKGHEEVYFAPEWNKSESEDSWTYAFAWILEEPVELNKNKFENYLTIYYDGLMKVAGASDNVATKVALTAVDGGYEGKVETLDGFFTKEPLHLHITIEPSRNPNIWIFRLSPKERGHRNWNILNQIQILE